MPRLRGQRQSKNEMHTNEAFTVKECPICNVCWDYPIKSGEPYFEYKDFPKISIEQEEICPKCKGAKS